MPTAPIPGNLNIFAIFGQATDLTPARTRMRRITITFDAARADTLWPPFPLS